jgi:hypothetical protein
MPIKNIISRCPDQASYHLCDYGVYNRIKINYVNQNFYIVVKIIPIKIPPIKAIISPIINLINDIFSEVATST